MMLLQNQEIAQGRCLVFTADQKAFEGAEATCQLALPNLCRQGMHAMKSHELDQSLFDIKH